LNNREKAAIIEHGSLLMCAYGTRKEIKEISPLSTTKTHRRLRLCVRWRVRHRDCARGQEPEARLGRHARREKRKGRTPAPPTFWKAENGAGVDQNHAYCNVSGAGCQGIRGKKQGDDRRPRGRGRHPMRNLPRRHGRALEIRARDKGDRGEGDDIRGMVPGVQGVARAAPGLPAAQQALQRQRDRERGHRRRHDARDDDRDGGQRIHGEAVDKAGRGEDEAGGRHTEAPFQGRRGRDRPRGVLQRAGAAAGEGAGANKVQREQARDGEHMAGDEQAADVHMTASSRSRK